jgi:hypothetical protein
LFTGDAPGGALETHEEEAGWLAMFVEFRNLPGVLRGF